MRGGISFPVLFISPNRDITVHGVTIVKARPDPLLEGAQLQLACAPARLRRRQEVFVLLQPEVEVPVWIQPHNRLAEEPFQHDQELINFRQLFSGVRKEIADLKLRMILPHIDR